ncbi:MAG: hypothetical protein CMH57_14635 [Myxococcales bacterium]|nr:hypothetical protein [Myxococcales bacterium]
MSAEIKVHLRYNLETGKKDIVIEYDSEDDALPYEHEQRHRQLVEELVGKGILDSDDVGNVLVGRVEKDAQGAPVVKPEAPAQQPEAVGEGS